MMRKYLDDRIGTTATKRLFDVTHVTIGGTAYSKNDLVTKLKTGNFAAAKNLERAMDEMGVKSIGNVDPEALAQIRGVGEMTIFVFLCAQEAERVQLLNLDDTTWRTYVANHRGIERHRNGGKKGTKKR